MHRTTAAAAAQAAGDRLEHSSVRLWCLVGHSNPFQAAAVDVGAYSMLVQLHSAHNSSSSQPWFCPAYSQTSYGVVMAALHVFQVGLLDIDICGPSAPKLTGLEGEEVHQSGSGWSPVYVQDNLAVMSIGEAGRQAAAQSHDGGLFIHRSQSGHEPAAAHVMPDACASLISN